MKKIILILILSLSFNSFSQTTSTLSNEDVERILSYKIKTVEDARLHEQEEYQLLKELADAINTLQALRKEHYRRRYDKEYLKQYKKKLFYGLGEPNSWNKDKDKLDDYLWGNIQLYREQWQRLSLRYKWISMFPRDIESYMKINDIENPERYSIR